MSTCYILSKKVSTRDLLCGRVDTFGIREYASSGTSDGSRCLTDGRNYLWVYLTEDGFVGSLTRYGANAPGKILAAISEAFETDVFSEHEPQYWGFDTQEEWDAAWKKMNDQDRDQFYADLVRIHSRRAGEIPAMDRQDARREPSGASGAGKQGQAVVRDRRHL